MKTNSIIDEIRRIRDEHAKEFNYDLNAIFADVKRGEREMRKRGWKFAKPNRKAIHKVAA
jgi:hypothetical protein